MTKATKATNLATLRKRHQEPEITNSNDWRTALEKHLSDPIPEGHGHSHAALAPLDAFNLDAWHRADHADQKRAERS